MKWDFSTILSIVLGILSIVLTIVIYFISTRKKKLQYGIMTVPLIKSNLSKLSNLKITYKENVVKELTTSIITFSNIGNDNIYHGDLSTERQLVINVNDGEFLNVDDLDYPMLTSKLKDNNKISFQIINNYQIKVLFEYLKPKDSFTLYFYHTGTVSVDCIIKNGKFMSKTDFIKSISFKHDFIMISSIGNAFFLSSLLSLYNIPTYMHNLVGVMVIFTGFYLSKTVLKIFTKYFRLP